MSIIPYEKQDRYYVVQRGDTLSAIGKKVKRHWRLLASDNRLQNPHLIYPGQLIKVPS